MPKYEYAVISHKIEDETYDSFREHIRQRDQFKNEVKDIESNIRTKLWDNFKKIEEETQAKQTKFERD